ncbi:conserved hypothetical protein [Sphingomonas sp. EC-HK361]|uniref:hypothetical protein n=1 Tax=Sphingomonas sp. EC-HK361 TaxID=2038397 RepID=UPI00125ABFBC|nr:hypothetical protein [Sphingomonas sp. EC-HK361]VVT20317.1 conserved hypothetical protein [Sphingomonas sp. EC-HK361]
MGNAISETGTLTTIHLAWIAVFAVLVVLGLIYGARLKRQRRQAQKIEEARIEDAAAEPDDPRLVIDPDATTTASAESAPVREEPEASLPEPYPLADEPVAAAEPAGAAPATIANSEPAPLPTAAGRSADAPVTTLKGLGPKVAARLGELGITTVGQIAALDDAQADALDAELGAFRGRMARDRWIEQARFLAAGDRAGFEAVFGRL